MRDSNSLHCLLDDDADAVRLARRRRLRSLAVSISAQALFITVVVVLPLLATGKMPVHRADPPTPIYFGVPGPAPIKQQQTGNPQKRNQPVYKLDPTIAPPVIPSSTPTADVEAPAVGDGGGEGLRICPTCRPDSPLNVLPPNHERGPRPPLPEPARPTAVTRIAKGGAVQEALLINKVTPQYPPLCKQMRLEGEIVLRAIIARDGSVQELTYVSGPPCFLQYSMNAVSQWRYRPTLLNGQPVEVDTTVRVVYRLNR